MRHRRLEKPAARWPAMLGQWSRSSALVAAAAVLAVFAGCLDRSTHGEEGVGANALPDSVDLAGCKAYQGLFGVDLAQAQALLPEPFLAAPFPGQSGVAAGDP